MTPQEQQMLDGLIDRVRSTQLTGKDSDADRRIQDTLGRDPNALYILCQTVLVQGYALEQAQKQLADLKEQQSTQQDQQQDQHQPSFLEKIFGRSEPDQPRSGSSQQQAAGSRSPGDQPQYGQPGYGRPGYNQPAYGQPAQPQYGQPVYNQQPAYPPQGYPAQGYPAPGGYGSGGFGAGGFGGGGFLQGALQTAAGVAMGELAFQSIEGLFRGFGHAAGYGSDRMMGLADTDAGNSNDDGGGDGFFSREQAENGVNDQLSPDIEDRRGDNSAQGFLGGSNDDSNAFADDSATDSGYDVDNSTTEDNGSDFIDDSSSFDDDGSFNDDNS